MSDTRLRPRIRLLIKVILSHPVLPRLLFLASDTYAGLSWGVPVFVFTCRGSGHPYQTCDGHDRLTIKLFFTLCLASGTYAGLCKRGVSGF